MCRRVPVFRAPSWGFGQEGTRFGGAVVEGCLWKLPLSPWRTGVYDLMRKFKSSDGDIIDQEAHRG